MLEEILAFICFILFISIVIWIMKNVDFDNEQYKDDVRYCEKCQWGFCTEIPRSKGCEKVRKLKDENVDN